MKANVSVLVLAFLLSGCAKQVVYKEVKVPIKCDVPKAQKPKKQSNTIAYLKEVLIYAERLERDLDFCRGAESQSTK